ncbi:C39 family peptidase [Cohnella laeviribosi]|uniref:C39 family peptidase n=1 Tax=Cohnella laeviribosi TaxID=380174 RepID=UPI000377F825|nr:C39 family peptidase [Cohnella laeviribosi]
MLIFRFARLLFTIFLIIALAFTSGLFSILLYAKISDRQLLIFSDDKVSVSVVSTPQVTKTQHTDRSEPMNLSKSAAMLDAPIIKQNPELYNGCELTSLTMLLQYYGISKSKMDLIPEMKKDTTPIQFDEHGNITYWGNPNLGFVGDITGKQKGYSIYHTALLDLLKSYIPTGVDLTGTSFDKLERQISDGIPVVVWTTIGYTEPKQWVVWDSPLGPIRATFSVHSVLLVGFDKQYVYVNDPLTGVKGQKVDKLQFIKSWETMGKQALSYRKN